MKYGFVEINFVTMRSLASGSPNPAPKCDPKTMRWHEKEKAVQVQKEYAEARVSPFIIRSKHEQDCCLSKNCRKIDGENMHGRFWAVHPRSC
mmetsp:Transcript_17854/g.43379  ORF Transcript_17854/g.43379 Transcript_17854/m.43379 type:complete len:92 (+) Transcript_17854:729-1004(+)